MDMHFHGVIFQTHAAELARRLRHPHPPFRVLDLRDADAYESAHIPGAVRVTLSGLEKGLPAGCNADTEFFVAGADPGDPSVRAASLALRRHGARRVVELPGGILEWRQAGHAVENSRSQAA